VGELERGSEGLRRFSASIFSHTEVLPKVDLSNSAGSHNEGPASKDALDDV
jgi:hypothetical protein